MTQFIQYGYTALVIFDMYKQWIEWEDEW